VDLKNPALCCYQGTCMNLHNSSLFLSKVSGPHFLINYFFIVEDYI